MDEVTVKKDELLVRMKANRDAHRGIFEQAQEVYRARVINLLDQRLKDAKAGRKIILAFALPEPVDYTEEYDAAIERFTWHQGDEIQLDSAEFKQYVLDKWGWERTFATSTRSYTQ